MMGKDEISLSEFCLLSRVSETEDGYKVEINLIDGSVGSLTVSDCSSVFDANERAYLYLVEKVSENKKKNF